MTLIRSEQMKSSMSLRPRKLTFQNSYTELLIKAHNYIQSTTVNTQPAVKEKKNKCKLSPTVIIFHTYVAFFLHKQHVLEQRQA